jgi:hypothetical protein
MRRDQRRRRKGRRVWRACVRNSVGGMFLYTISKNKEIDGERGEHTLIGLLRVSTSVRYTNTFAGEVSNLDCCSY